MPWGAEADIIDAFRIEGNVLPETKRKVKHILRKDAVGRNNFASHIGNNVTITKMDVTPQEEDPRRLEARIEYECVVDKSMLDICGILHGGCIAYLMDLCTSGSLVVLYVHTEYQGGGIASVIDARKSASQSLQIAYHASAKEGTLLKIIGYTVVGGDRTHTVRGEIWDSTNRRLVATGGQYIVLLSEPKVQSKL